MTSPLWVDSVDYVYIDSNKKQEEKGKTVSDGLHLFYLNSN